MRATWLFRVTSILLVLFAILHTIGFLTFSPPTSDGQAALAAMNSAHLEKAGTTYTYGMFYRGFGIFLTVYLLFSAYVAWYLGNVTRSAPSAAGALPTALTALQLANLVIAAVYFSPPPITFSAIAFLCSAAAAVAARSSVRMAESGAARP
jgi:hypothetical protein